MSTKVVLVSWLLPFNPHTQTSFPACPFNVSAPGCWPSLPPLPLSFLSGGVIQPSTLTFHTTVDTKPKVYMKWLQLFFPLLFSTELPNFKGRLMILPEDGIWSELRVLFCERRNKGQTQPTLTWTSIRGLEDAHRHVIVFNIINNLMRCSDPQFCRWGGIKALGE